MKDYKCENCNKKFDRKSNYDSHVNRKNPCNKLLLSDKIIENKDCADIVESNDKLKIITQIDNNYIQKCLNEYKCAYCNKKYTQRGNIVTHIKYHCKKVKEIENEKHVIFTKLKQEQEENRSKEIEKKLLETEKKLLETQEILALKEENQKIKLTLEKMQKELNKCRKVSNKINNSNINTGAINSNINSNNNNTINNNQQNITLVGYKEEDLDIIDKSEILTIMKRGFQAPVELTRTIHFNPKYPEFHNIYIPKINEKYGMVFTNGKWRLIDKNDLVDDIYENKRDFIIQNYDNFVNQLDEFKKKSLKRWLNTDENDDESIINTKEDIKRLLFDNRHLAMDKKRIMDREARKLEIVQLPKKVDKKEICDIKIESVSESSDTESDSSDSTYYSNYSYVKSGDEHK
jgi:hypothetical protein